jgi:hypothetical protein
MEIASAPSDEEHGVPQVRVDRGLVQVIGYPDADSPSCSWNEQMI